MKKVLEAIGSPSLRELINRGIDIPYSSLKNYYSEARLLPKELFDQLLYLGKIDISGLDIEFVGDNWGNVVGGKKGRKRNV
jgi:hypothetical protein